MDLVVPVMKCFGRCRSIIYYHVFISPMSQVITCDILQALRAHGQDSVSDLDGFGG